MSEPHFFIERVGLGPVLSSATGRLRKSLSTAPLLNSTVGNQYEVLGSVSDWTFVFFFPSKSKMI